jgi:subfamily B ATP-binding cassette protein MsbA
MNASGKNIVVDASILNRAWTSWPVVWTLIKPRRAIIAVGIGLLVVNRIAGLVLPASTKYLVDNVIVKRQIELLAPLVLAVLGATAFESLTAYSLTQFISKAAQRMIAELRIKVQAHVGKLPISFYDANKTGVLISRIMSDVEGVRNILGTGIINFIGGLITALFALIFLFRTSMLLTMVVCGGLILFGIAQRRAFKLLRRTFRSRSTIHGEVTARLIESLSGVRVVKGYHAEQREAKTFQSGAYRLLSNAFETLTATSFNSMSTTFFVGGIGALIMLIGAHQILSGKLTPGDLFSYVAFLAILIAPVIQVVGIIPSISEALAGLERTQELLNQPSEDGDVARVIRLDRVRGYVTFEDVNFSYNSKKSALYNVSFRAEPDTLTALVGPSGAGKSTTIGLIVGFYSPSAGRVLVDGIDLSAVQLDSFRTQLGVVLQDSFLFDGTIWENIAFSRPEAGEREILNVCRIARVDEFAETLEKKYQTCVGERGVKLSGGQKQRISIARAILADPRILILDEATSSLDSESEAMIQEGLRYLMRGRTTFVIAHRLSTIRRADQILVFESGRIIERGIHESLYSARGRYHDLYTKQHGLQATASFSPGTAGDFEKSRED